MQFLHTHHYHHQKLHLPSNIKGKKRKKKTKYQSQFSNGDLHHGVFILPFVRHNFLYHSRAPHPSLGTLETRLEPYSLKRHTVRLFFFFFTFFAIVFFFRFSPLLLSIHRQRNINLVMFPLVVGDVFCEFSRKIRVRWSVFGARRG